ncbi:MAG: TldD/PmbA family protein, partial [Candidatus Aminicenantes bacterium]
MMEYQKIAETIIKKAMNLGVDEAEAYIERDRNFNLLVRNGEVDIVKQSSTKGIGLTIYQDKKLGFSYTSDFTSDALEEFTKRTVQLAAVADPKPWNGLPDYGKEEKQKDLDLWDPSILEIEDNQKIDIAKKVEKIALSCDKRITNSSGGRFRDAESETIIVNSKGISRSFKTTSVSFNVSVIAGEGNNMQSGGWSSSKRHFKELAGIEEVAQEAGKRAVEKLGAKPVKTAQVPVVFDRYAAGSFWRGILFAFNGDSVYKKTTFLTDSLDKPVASKLITITDNPTIPRHVGSVPFDGEGKITRENTLVANGTLKMFIYDSATALKAGVKVNTMARRRGYKGIPSAGTLNTIVQNGNINRDKIIQGIKEGFYVTGLRGSGTDVTTGTF